MMRIVTAAILAAFAGIFAGSFGRDAQAQTAPSGTTDRAGLRLASPTAVRAAPAAAERGCAIYPRYEEEPDWVYPRYFPGPNAVRDCTATYVQEYRPSGTVITPRMNCFWRRG